MAHQAREPDVSTARPGFEIQTLCKKMGISVHTCNLITIEGGDRRIVVTTLPTSLL